jgi:hypothetical protein
MYSSDGSGSPILLQAKLQNDALRRMSSRLISSEEYRRMFDEHISALAAAVRRQYLVALNEVVRPALVDAQDGKPRPPDAHGDVARDWEAASEALAVHACFQKIPAAEREATWKLFVHDVCANIPNPGMPKAGQGVTRLPGPGGGGVIKGERERDRGVFRKETGEGEDLTRGRSDARRSGAMSQTYRDRVTDKEGRRDRDRERDRERGRELERERKRIRR